MLLGFVLNSSNPAVSPNKAMIRNAVELSFNKTLVKNSITLPAKIVEKAINKTTSEVIDSIVQTTTYVATPQNEVNTTMINNDIVNGSMSKISSLQLSSNPDVAINTIATSIKDASFGVIAKNKINIRYNYENDILIFVVLGILSVLLAVLLKLEDKKKGYGLELPNIEKTAE